MNCTNLLQARRTIHELIWQTPLVRSYWLSEQAGADVYLKLENVQLTGSFKLRGALNKLKQLASETPRREILTVSAGNHGRAVAYGAELFGLTATVIVPKSAPKTKVEAISRHKVNLLLLGEDYDEAERQAREMAAARSDVVFVSPYNDPDVIAGQGTVALEMLEAMPQLDALLVPVSGGGLLAGVALAAKTLNPKIKVYGVQSENSPAMLASFRAGRIVEVVERETIADGLAGNIEAGSITFPIIAEYADDILLVSEDAIREAIVLMLKHEHQVVEGAGVVTVAALTSGAAKVPGRKLGLIVSGSNIDLHRLIAVATTTSVA
jgi:threonine dehydratase